MADPNALGNPTNPTIPTPDPTAIQANSVLWYNVGIFGTIGYGVPYLSPERLTTCNRDLKDLVDTFGRLLFAIMAQPDVWTSASPTRTWLQLAGRAVDRFRLIVAARKVPDGQLDERPAIVTPAQEAFLIYPVPYFNVRNSWAKRWCSNAMMTLAEAMKSHDNIFPYGFHSALAGTMSMYTEMIYRELSVELLGKAVPAPDPKGAPTPPMPTLLDADYAAYSTASIYTATERVDQGAPLNWQLPSETL